MNPDRMLNVRLDAVIQLIHEHTNAPVVQPHTKIYTDCPVKIVQKSAGCFAFVNAAEQKFSVRVEVPLFLPETITLEAGFHGFVRTLRMSPVPDHVLGEPSAGQTYICGKGMPDERVFLHCNMRFCRIVFVKLLEDGCALFESRNFQDAGTRRTLLLTDGAGNRQFITTRIDAKYFPKQFFLSEQPLTRLDTRTGVTAEPVITIRADHSGKYLAAAAELCEGACTVLAADGSIQKQYPFTPGGRFIME